MRLLVGGCQFVVQPESSAQEQEQTVPTTPVSSVRGPRFYLRCPQPNAIQIAQTQSPTVALYSYHSPVRDALVELSFAELPSAASHSGQDRRLSQRYHDSQQSGRSSPALPSSAAVARAGKDCGRCCSRCTNELAGWRISQPKQQNAVVEVRYTGWWRYCAWC